MADLSKLNLAQLSRVANARIIVESRGAGPTATVEFEGGHETVASATGATSEGTLPPIGTSESVLQDATWVAMESQEERVELDPESFLEIAPRMLTAIAARPEANQENFGALPQDGYINGREFRHKVGCSTTVPKNGTSFCHTHHLLFVGKALE